MSCIVGWFIDMLYIIERFENMSKMNGMWVVTDVDVDINPLVAEFFLATLELA